MAGARQGSVKMSMESYAPTMAIQLLVMVDVRVLGALPLWDVIPVRIASFFQLYQTPGSRVRSRR
jgi:hypothetical protein